MEETIKEWIIHIAIVLVGIVFYIAGFHEASYLILLAISIAMLARALLELRDRKISVEFLMGIAGIVVIYYGYLMEGLVIMLLYGVAEIIENIASHYALRKMEKLVKLIPNRSVIVKEGFLSEIDTDELRPGDVVLVRKGDVVPADGVVLDKGVFDTSMITGESEPVVIIRGGRVKSGYINSGNPVKVKILKNPSDSTLQRTIEYALKAMESKSYMQRTIERIAPILTVLVIGGFMAASYIWGPIRALPILLAGCPSAFIIVSGYSTAMSIAMMARSGIIVKGGKALETAHHIKVVAFDKTGTLTLGGLSVASYMPSKNVDKDKFLALVASAASSSNHPVSKALSSISTNRMVADEIKEYPSLGLEAVFKDYKVVIGSDRLVKKKKPGININGDIVKCVEKGYKPLYVLVNGELGYVCLEEQVEKGSNDVIRELINSGYEVVILSGDKKEKVEQVALKLGIMKYYYELSPSDKLDLIKELRSKRGKVAMVGDGINDLAALAAADLGVSVGNIEAVNNVADVSLANGVKDLMNLFLGARKYVASLYAGIISALIIKVFTITLGIMGYIPLITAVLIGDDGSTVISVIISTLILFGKRYRLTLSDSSSNKITTHKHLTINNLN